MHPAVANTKDVWNVLLSAAEAATRKVDGESTVALDALVEAELTRHPHLTPTEVKLLRQAAYDLSRFAALYDGAFQGYCSCFKRNGSSRPAMYLVAYLLTFPYASLGEAAVCQLLDACMPQPRLCEYVQYLFTANLIRQFSAPLWRATYDDHFIQQHILQPLAVAGADAGMDIAGWLRRHLATPPADLPSSSDASDRAVNGGNGGGGGGAAATSTSTRPTRVAGKKEGSSRTPPPPPLHPSTKPRLPPYEVREMASTVPEPRLPRIKDAPLPSRVVASRAPTRPLGFSFHQREAASHSIAGPSDGAGAAAAAAGVSVVAASSSSSSLPPAARGGGAAVAAPWSGGGAAAPLPRPSSSQLRRMLNASKALPTTTTTALRREACTRDRQRAHAAKALSEMEVAARDATEYDLWRQGQEEEEERQREMEVMQRHLDALETEERVRAQRSHAAEQRRRRFRNIRAKYQEELEARKAEEEEAVVRQGESVQQQRTQQLQDRIAAQEKATAVKATLATQVKNETEDLKAAAQEAEEVRQTQQALFIQEIHRMRRRVRESRARMGEDRHRAWADGEEDAALGRMSLAELHDAVARLRDEEAAEVEARHEHVSTLRGRAQAERERLEGECASARAVQRQRRHSKQSQRAQHRASVDEARATRETTRMIQLHEKLEEKRQAAREVRHATREAERQRRNELMLRARDSTSMEQGRWAHHEAGMVRRAKWEQQGTMQEAQK